MADIASSAVESALKNIEKVAETGGYLKKEVKEALLHAVSEIREYLEFLRMKTVSDNDDKKDQHKEGTHNQQNKMNEVDDGSTEVQLATSVGDSSGGQNKSQQAEPPSGEQRNLGENHDSGMQEGHKMPETTEDDRSDISRKVDRIADFLQNKLEKLIEEKIKESLGNATTRRELRSTAEESRDQQEEGNKPDSPTIEKREGKNGEPRHWDGQEDEVEGTWTRVTYGRSNRTNRTQGAKQTIGTNTRMDEDIQAAQRYAWLFLGRLKEDTTADKVKKYLHKNGIQGNTICEEIESRGRNKAFKLGIPLEYLGEANDPNFWPEGVVVRRYRFRRTYQNEGVSLDY